VKGHTIELNLLRSVLYPGARVVRDEDVLPGEPHGAYTDQAVHHFRYALYPHRGDLVEGRVPQAAYEFNHPLQIQEIETVSGDGVSFFQLDAANVIIETVKKAEDGPELIVRLYETGGIDTHTMLHFGFAVNNVEEVDLMEQPLHALALQLDSVHLHFKPFELVSLKIN
jgi:alpha-mannosidase